MLFLRFKEYQLKKCLNNFSSSFKPIRLYKLIFQPIKISPSVKKLLKKEFENISPFHGFISKFFGRYILELTVQIIASLRSEVNLAVGLVLFTFHSISMKM